MNTRKVQNPNEKGSSAFIWAVLAVLAIAALVIGIIVYSGQSAQRAADESNLVDIGDISASWSEGDSLIRLAANDSQNAPSAELFDDFSCSHCAELEEATGDKMLDALKNGEIEVELRPMVAQDSDATGQLTVGHSTRSLASMLAMFAQGDTRAALSFRSYMMKHQQDVYNKLELDDMAELAERLGASDEALKDIRDGRYIDTAHEISIANQELQSERDPDGKTWTPRVMIDGADVPDSERYEWVELTASGSPRTESAADPS